jgi:hypothetical protein
MLVFADWRGGEQTGQVVKDKATLVARIELALAVHRGNLQQLQHTTSRLHGAFHILDERKHGQFDGALLQGGTLLHGAESQSCSSAMAADATSTTCAHVTTSRSSSSSGSSSSSSSSSTTTSSTSTTIAAPTGDLPKSAGSDGDGGDTGDNVYEDDTPVRRRRRARSSAAAGAAVTPAAVDVDAVERQREAFLLRVGACVSKASSVNDDQLTRLVVCYQRIGGLLRQSEAAASQLRVRALAGGQEGRMLRAYSSPKSRCRACCLFWRVDRSIDRPTD